MEIRIYSFIYHFLLYTGLIFLSFIGNSSFAQTDEVSLTQVSVSKVNCNYPFQKFEGDQYSFSQLSEVNTPYSNIIRYSVSQFGLPIVDAQLVLKEHANTCSVISSLPMKLNLVEEIEEQDDYLLSTEYGLIPVKQEEGRFFTYFLNGNDTLLMRDRRRYLSDSLPATVFLPDPLTSSETEYGEIISDNDDNATSAIFQEYKDVLIAVDAQQELKNEWVWITEFSGERTGPYLPPYTRDRTEATFEAVNAYYHTNRLIQRIIGLGYGSVFQPETPIEIDVSATQEDNSYFLSSPNQLQLAFGTGGVDDAEDADVVIHEFLHALSYIAAPGSNEGLVRRGIDEGLGDYLASSHSKLISDYEWRKVFSWDGHNEYFQGRTNKNGQTLNIITDSSNIYSTSQLVGALLCDILEATSIDFTDQLVLELLPSLVPNMNFSSFSQLLLLTSEIIGGQDAKEEVIGKLLNREFIDFPVELNNNYAILTNTIQQGGPPRLYLTQDGRENILQLFNVSGQLVWASEPTSDKVIDLPNFQFLPSSVYVLILKSTLNETLFSETISVDNFR